MKKRKTFESPRVLRQVEVQLERDLLNASIRFSVISMGQAVDEYNFDPETDGDYTAEWNN